MAIFTKKGFDIFAALNDIINNSEAQIWSTELESIIEAAVSGGNFLLFTTKALLDADLAYPANTAAMVLGESDANDGIYQKSGASGSGSWTKVAEPPGSGFLKATDSGGTQNAITATTTTAANETQLISLPIVITNTSTPVTVAFNGGAALTIKTQSGINPAIGGLVSGSTIAGYIVGTEFHMLSDQASTAIQTAAEAAQTAAEAAAASIDYRVFDTVAAMVADGTLSIGDDCQTLGYSIIGDGGDNLYKIVAAATGTDDGGTYIDLATYQAQALFPSFYKNVLQFGAVGDGKFGSDGAITAASSSFVSAGATFVAADVGKTISVDGAGAAGITLVTTISGFTNGTTVTLTVAAGTTVSGAKYSYGKDNAVPFAAALALGGRVHFPKADLPYLTTQIVLPKNTVMYGDGADSVVHMFFDTEATNTFRADVNALRLHIKDMVFDGASENGTPKDDQGTTTFLFNVNAFGDPAIDGHGLPGNALNINFDNCVFNNPIGYSVIMYGSDTYDTEELLSVTNCLFQGGADTVNSNLGRLYIMATNTSNLTITGNQFIGKANDGGGISTALNGFSAINITANGASFRSTYGSYVFANNRLKYCGNLKHNAIECYSHPRSILISGNRVEECNAVGGIRFKNGLDSTICIGNIVRHARNSDANSNGIVLAAASTSLYPDGVGEQVIIANNTVHDVQEGIVVIGDSTSFTGKFKSVVVTGNIVSAWGSVAIDVDAIDGAVVSNNILDNSYHDIADNVIAAASWLFSTDTITATAHSYKDQQGPVRLTTSGTLPAGFSASTNYFIRVVDANTIQLALTRTGNDIVDFTDAGTGSHTVSIYRLGGAIQIQDSDGNIVISGNDISGLIGSQSGIAGSVSGSLDNSAANLIANGNSIAGADTFGIYARHWRSIHIKGNWIETTQQAIRYGNTTALSVIDGNTYEAGAGAYSDDGSNTDMRIGVNFI
jgi:hypothetical protein